MKYILFILVIFISFSCGGGNSGSEEENVPTSVVTNRSPVINGLEDSVTIPENQTSVVSVSASDPDTATLTYSLSGTDSISLSISNTGVITFNTAPDYESKNSYSINVNVSDGKASVSQALIINISDVVEPYQTQLGANLVGEANGDEFGHSISLSPDGTLLAIGAPGNNNDTGHVRVFLWDGASWTQRGADIDGEGGGDRSATSLSISPPTTITDYKIAIGSPISKGSVGNALVYEWNGTAWIKYLSDMTGGSPQDLSGTSIDMISLGQTVVVGAPFNDQEGDNAGRVRVWASSGTSWGVRANIADSVAGDQFGTRVSMSLFVEALSGQALAISAPHHDQSKGTVKIYQFNTATGNYVQLGSDIDGEGNGDQSGNSLEISSDGTTIAIGAILNDGNGNDAGHVRVFAWDGMSWVQRGVDIQGGSAGDQFGADVSLNSDGTILAVSSSQNNNSKGYVKVYDWNGSSWIQSGNTITGSSSGDSCGNSISLSNDGSILAIGCPSTGSLPGYAKVYQR